MQARPTRAQKKRVQPSQTKRYTSPSSALSISRRPGPLLLRDSTQRVKSSAWSPFSRVAAATNSGRFDFIFLPCHARDDRMWTAIRTSSSSETGNLHNVDRH
jgi:hypothetical protein